MSQASSRISAKQLRRHNFAHAYFTFYNARAALGGHKELGDAGLLSQAKRHVRTLRRLDAGFGGFADALQATIAEREGRKEEAIALTRRAIDQFSLPDDRRMLYAKHRLGTLIGGDKGIEITEVASNLLRQQGIKNPDRWVAMILGEAS